MKNLVNYDRGRTFDVYDRGRTFDVIKSVLEDLGYKVFYKVLNSKTSVFHKTEKGYIL